MEKQSMGLTLPDRNRLPTVFAVVFRCIIHPADGRDGSRAALAGTSGWEAVWRPRAARANTERAIAIDIAADASSVSLAP
jgi:hypothetical protein